MANTPRIDRIEKNYLINGNFDFWQRNTTFSATGYTADRWRATISGTATISRNASAVPDGALYTARYTSGGGASFILTQALESHFVRGLRGKTVTITVKVKRNSTYDANLIFALEKNSTADTSTGGTWSAITTTTLATASIATADYQTLSLSAIVPNDGTANGLRIYIGHTGSAANGSILDIGSAMLVIGDTAPTAFNSAGGNYMNEFQLCQRYYERATVLIQWDAVTGGVVTLGWPFMFKVTKRTTPSSSVSYLTGNGGFQNTPNIQSTADAAVITIGSVATGPATRSASLEYLVDAEL